MYVCVLFVYLLVLPPLWMLQCVCALGLLDRTLGCLVLRLFAGKVQPQGGKACLSEAIKQLAGSHVKAQKTGAMQCR